MSESCTTCGAKPGRGGVILQHKKGCSLAKYPQNLTAEDVPHPDDFRAKTQEVIRAPHDLPEVGDWYVVSFRSTVDVDTATDRQNYVLDVIVAPCLSIEQHGRDYRVSFDMERTKQFVAHFPGQLIAKAEEFATMLHSLAVSLEGVK